MMGEEDEMTLENDVNSLVEDMETLLHNQTHPGEISLNALYGNKSPNSIRFQGTIKNKKVSILIDSGSTHSFIDSSLLKQLNLPVSLLRL